jgi:S-adenosylmethionine:tRNA ribosyltransferase-isomerase
MHVHELDYAHPPESVAQRPAPERDAARLLLVPASGPFLDSCVSDLPSHVVRGDVFVVNDSRVRPARLFGARATGGRVQLLLLERRPGGWLAMLKSSRTPKVGAELHVGDARLRLAAREGDLFVLEEISGDLEAVAAREGVPPLPPYIRREADEDDVERYQTTHARRVADAWGGAGSSVAAPTAGLHFTPALRERLIAAGASIVAVSLGVGPGTFRPIESDDVEDHRMHEEPLRVGAEAASAVNDALAAGRRVTAVGTTSLRALEAATTPAGRVRAVEGRTGLFLVPGARIRTATRILTNFHQPCSTLLALVAAFAGTDRALEAHRTGVARGYRLFSYGDAMLVDRA